MKNFLELTVDNFEQCNDELQRIFKEDHPDPAAIAKWVTVQDSASFFKRCPTVVESFNKLGLEMYSVVMITIFKDSGFKHNHPHLDALPKSCRIHWPVYNAESVVTKWYNYDGDPRSVGLASTGTPEADYYKLDIDKCTLAEQLVIRRPTIINVHAPHSAEIIGTMPSPRVAYTFNVPDVSVLEKMMGK